MVRYYHDAIVPGQRPYVCWAWQCLNEEKQERYAKLSRGIFVLQSNNTASLWFPALSEIALNFVMWLSDNQAAYIISAQRQYVLWTEDIITQTEQFSELKKSELQSDSGLLPCSAFIIHIYPRGDFYNFILHNSNDVWCFLKFQYFIVLFTKVDYILETFRL